MVKQIIIQLKQTVRNRIKGVLQCYHVYVQIKN